MTTHIVATCPNCGTTINITQVRCVKCKRLCDDGDYTLAPARSIYAGHPLCSRCIDGIVRDSLGPSEYK